MYLGFVVFTIAVAVLWLFPVLFWCLSFGESKLLNSPKVRISSQIKLRVEMTKIRGGRGWSKGGLVLGLPKSIFWFVGRNPRSAVSKFLG